MPYHALIANATTIDMLAGRERRSIGRRHRRTLWLRRSGKPQLKRALAA